MQEIEGRLYDGTTARSRDARLRVYSDGSVRLRAESQERALTISDLEVSARLGNTARRIGLPGGSEFETLDNDAVDAVLEAHAQTGRNWVHRLESRLGLVLASSFLVLAAGATFVLWGVPALAREAAFAVPQELSAHIASGTLEVLDRTLDASELSAQRQAELKAHFREIAAAAPRGYDFELVFRAGGGLGANAFALPSGSVLMTDELVGLAERDEEIVAVLAHEVGHVVHRHGLRHAIQSSMLAMAILLVTGDLSSTSSFVAALPTALAESKFSREFEGEADDHAVAYLRESGISPMHFAALLQRLAEERGEAEGIVTFLSTHPSTDERIERLEEQARLR
ncbi:MAG: M48 family metallopeptidase [Deltaproteobacteria bacterium]|nr:M48 family metallopeptidase [Deltaproteobacteria bacterium]MBW2360017.1 M48 family metallopeptidase [Deltaproteobacteria bacterium]